MSREGREKKPSRRRRSRSRRSRWRRRWRRRRILVTCPVREVTETLWRWYMLSTVFT